MAELSRFIVEQIRVSYASGLYHKADLAVRYSCNLNKPQDILDILEYKIYVDVRQDLRLKIYGMNFIFAVAEDYHKTINEAAQVECENVRFMKQNAPSTLEEVVKRTSDDALERIKQINESFGTTFTLFDIKSRLHIAL